MVCVKVAALYEGVEPSYPDLLEDLELIEDPSLDPSSVAVNASVCVG